MGKPAGKKDRFVKREPKEFDEQVIQIDRVTRVVKGGRKLRFRATVAIGNRKGKVGIGVGKSHEVTGAIQKAISKAKRSMFTVIMDGSTIPHDVKIKYKAAKILLLPAVEGTGLIAGGTVRKVLELAGIKNILSKSYGTTNKLNNSKATFEALKLLKTTPGMTRRAQKATTAKPVEAKETKEVNEVSETKEVKKAPEKKAAPKASPKKKAE